MSVCCCCFFQLELSPLRLVTKSFELNSQQTNKIKNKIKRVYCLTENKTFLSLQRYGENLTPAHYETA